MSAMPMRTCCSRNCGLAARRGPSVQCKALALSCSSLLSPSGALQRNCHDVVPVRQAGLPTAAMSLLLGLSMALGPAALDLAHPAPAAASTVRLEDVENPLMQEGLRAATQGEFSRARLIFRELLDEDSSSASTWSNLGNVEMSLGHADLAVGDYNQAVKLAPDAPVPHLNRAIALEQLGLELESQGSEAAAQTKWQAAVDDCNTAIQLDPREYAAWFNKGNVEMRLEQYETAEESFRTAADLAPGLPGYRLRQAQLVFQNGDTAAATRLARTVCRKNPNYAEAYASLAAMLYQDGQLDKAEDAYNTATQVEPSLRNIDFVLQNTRWPPRLYNAFAQFLKLEAVGP